MRSRRRSSAEKRGSLTFWVVPLAPPITSMCHAAPSWAGFASSHVGYTPRQQVTTPQVGYTPLPDALCTYCFIDCLYGRTACPYYIIDRVYHCTVWPAERIGAGTPFRNDTSAKWLCQYLFEWDCSVACTWSVCITRTCTYVRDSLARTVPACSSCSRMFDLVGSKIW